MDERFIAFLIGEQHENPPHNPTKKADNRSPAAITRFFPLIQRNYFPMYLLSM